MRQFRRYHASNKLIYIHIPKTAGATFRSILSKNYNNKNSFFIHDLYPETSLDYLKGISDIMFNNYSLIAGHGTQYLLAKASKFKSIVFLRNPIDQIISSFYHIKRSPYNYNHQNLKNVSNLEDYFYFLKGNNGFNYQTMFLSRNESDFKNRKSFYEISEQSFITALNLLKKIDYIFITENFNESLYILKQDFQFNHLYYIIRNNSKNRSVEEKNNDLLSKIKYEQKWDYKLYEYAQMRYLKLRSKYSPEIEEYVNKFQTNNNLYNKTIGNWINFEETISKSIKSTFRLKNSWETKPKYDP